MSILFKTNGNVINNKISGGGSGEGFPPADIEILEIRTTTGVVSVKWKDPDNTVIDNTTLATWAGTILVRNDNHYPNSIDDGTIVVDSTTKNAYKNTWCYDEGLTDYNTYYYRFFPYSTEGVYNDSNNLIFKKTCGSIGDPVFGNNSWATINECIEKNNIPPTWQIGDKKLTSMRGGNYEINFQIWDFDHFEKADGSGKAKMVIGITESYRSGYMNENDTKDTDGYRDTYMNKSGVIQHLLEDIASDEFYPYIKEVIIPYNEGALINQPDQINDMTAKLFIPSDGEVGFSYPDLGTRFQYFTQKSRRRMKSVAGYYAQYWTRTACGHESFYHVPDNGGENNTHYFSVQNEDNNVIVCFCI